MTDTSMVPRKRDGDRLASPRLIDEELADQLLGKAQAEGVELLGPLSGWAGSGHRACLAGRRSCECACIQPGGDWGSGVR